MKRKLNDKIFVGKLNSTYNLLIHEFNAPKIKAHLAIERDQMVTYFEEGRWESMLKFLEKFIGKKKETQPTMHLHLSDVVEADKKDDPPIMKSHEQRVVDELNELLVKAEKLGEFISGNAIFPTLPMAEQKRLKEQKFYMDGYATVLKDRIANFPK